MPVAGAVLPSGKVMLWSAEERMSFSATGRTYTSLFDPVANTFAETLVSNTGHNMFCPGTTNLPDGRILVNGGIDSGKTSIYDPTSNSWSTAAPMNIARGYNANTLLQDGSVFTLGGSWSGGVGNKHGEVWTAAGGWRRLSGVPVDSMWAGLDTSRNFGNDAHMWLLPTGNGRVLYAGPSVNMQWISTAGNGSVEFAGKRGDDEFSVNGTAVMYDAGKILKNGGAPGYEGFAANANSYVIDVNNGVSVRKIASMAYRRAFHNDVVLPNGQVVVIGGQTFERAFTDDNSVLAAELFDPATESWTTLPPMTVPRNYHGISLLLPDARVMAGGGGLCGGCNANHPDVQILSPHYLFNADGSAADRPVISSAPATVGYGTTMNVTTNSAIGSFSLVRIGSTTHTVNNDQRRVALDFSTNGAGNYTVSVPSNPGILLPGYWMLFAMNANGVPSVARIVRVDASGSPRLTSPADQSSSVNSATSLSLVATDPTGAPLNYTATGLPPGLNIDSSGLISGTPGGPGRFAVTVSARNGSQAVSSNFIWTVSDPGSTRFVKLEALSEVAGNPWTSMAEFNLLDANGQALSRGGWTVAADSVELAGEYAPAISAIDGDAATFWHSQWQAASPPPPHSFVVNLGGAYEVSGFRYLPRSGGGNGTIAQYRFHTSADGVNWGAPAAQGNFVDLGANGVEKTVYLTNVAKGKLASQSSTNVSAGPDRAVDGNSDGVYGNNSVSHTMQETSPWWEVDLGVSHQVQALRLWNRTDCCANRLSNFYMLSSELPMAGRSLAALLADVSVKRVAYTGTAPRAVLIESNGRARYLRVQLNNTNVPLQLAEVEVFGKVAVNGTPSITPPTVSSLVQGQAVTQAVSARDPDGDTLAFSASGLPTGLGINASSGVISGTAAAEGVFTVSLRVDDARGGTASTSFTWSVTAAPPAIGNIGVPVIGSGGTAVYTAPVSGGGSYEYQWDFGDGSAATTFSSTATTSHAYPGPGVYTVTLTVRSADGTSVTSSFVQAVTGAAAVGKPMNSSNLALESRTGGSTRLWIVNPDNDSVSVFDAATRTRLAEINVGTQPRSLAVAPDGRIWVVNKTSATLSVINAGNLSVAQTVALPRASMPYGIVFNPADASALVSLEGKGQVLKLAGTGNIIATLDVGANPRHLAISAGGDRLLVSRFISPPLPGEGTAAVSTTDASGAFKGGEVVVVAPATMTIQRTVVLRHSDKLDTTVQGRGVPNYLGAAVISPDGLSAWVPGKQDNVKRGTLRDGLNLDFQNTVRAISSRIDLQNQAEDYAARIDHDNAGVASAAAYHPNGAYLFVALETNRQVAVIDAARKRELFRVEAGRAPQGLAVSADGKTLYVHNFMDRTVSMLDLTPLLTLGQMRAPALATPAAIGTEKLAANVLKGKQFFYDARDPRLARDSYMSCAACHNDGGQDGRTWDFTGLGEGLRNTISLRGRAGAQGLRHWSGNFDEIQDFEGQIRNFALGTGLMNNTDFNTGSRGQPLGDKKAGISADLDSLAAYLGSLNSFAPSPHRNADATLSSAAQAGRTVFTSKNCASCHGGSAFTASGDATTLRNVGTIRPSSGSRLSGALAGIDIPTLRDVWATAPYLHDGSAATLPEAVRAHTTLAISATEADSLAVYLREIGSEENSAPTATPASGTGLLGQYFSNNSLAGNAALQRTEAINYTWGAAAPAAGIPADNFSVRWAGTIEAPSSGTYFLRTNSDDGVRVWINDSLVIDNWTAHAATYNTSAAIALVANQRYAVRVEYMELTGQSVISLQWRLPGTTSYVAVPANRLYGS